MVRYYLVLFYIMYAKDNTKSEEYQLENKCTYCVRRQ